MGLSAGFVALGSTAPVLPSFEPCPGPRHFLRMAVFRGKMNEVRPAACVCRPAQCNPFKDIRFNFWPVSQRLGLAPRVVKKWPQRWLGMPVHSATTVKILVSGEGWVNPAGRCRRGIIRKVRAWADRFFVIVEL